MDDERVEAAAKAVERELLRLQEEGVFWRDGTEAIARAALAAFDAVEGERVVYRNESGEHQPSNTIPSLAAFWVFDNEELVVRKRRTNGIQQ